MQLLDPTKVEAKRLASEDADLSRLASLRKFIEQEELKLKTKQAEYAVANVRINNDLSSLLALHMGKVASSKKEIDELEVRKALALQPIDSLWEELERAEDDLAVLTSAQTKRHEELEYREGELILAAVNLDNRQAKIEADESKLAEQTVSNMAETQAVASEKVMLHTAQNAFEARLTAKNKEIELRLIELGNHETELVARETQIKTDKDNIAKDKARIASQQATLKLAYDEIQNKK